MTVKERLTKYLKSKKIRNTEFCKTIGVSNAFVSSMRKSIQPDKVESIALHYPDLNIGWLMTGEGEMLKNNNILNTGDIHYNDGDWEGVANSCISIIEQQQETIYQLTVQNKKLLESLEMVLNILHPEEDSKDEKVG